MSGIANRQAAVGIDPSNVAAPDIATSQASTERTPLLTGDASSSEQGNSYGAAQEEDSSDTPQEDGPKVPNTILIPTMVALFASIILAAIDGVLVTTLLAPISSSFSASEKASWLGTSYLLSVTAFCAAYGKLCDIMGRRSAMLLALGLFALGNGLCAIAPTINALIMARAVAGIGGAGLQVISSVIMTDLLSFRQRGMWQGFANVIFSIGTASGGPLGGYLHEHFGWRFAFAAQLPLLAIAAVAVALFVRIPLSDEIKNQSWQVKVKRLDIPGIIALVGTILCSQLAITFFSANELPLGNPLVWGLLLASLIFLALFLYIENNIAVEPVLPLRLLKTKSVALMSAFFFLASFYFMGINYHTPLYFESVLLLSPTAAGARFSPMSLSVSIGSLSAGLYIRKVGKYKTLLTITTALTVVSALVMTTWSHEKTPSIIYWTSGIPLGLGGAAAGTIALIALISTIKDSKDFAVVNGLMYLARSLGSVMGVGLSGALSQTIITSELNERITQIVHPHEKAKALVEYIRHNAAAVGGLSNPLVKEAAIMSYEKGIRAIFIAALVVSIVVFLICLPVEEAKLDSPSPVAKATAAQQATNRSNEEGERGQ
ncbi:unnamed protein product [Sympodiomycopsis kandeliae]